MDAIGSWGRSLMLLLTQPFEQCKDPSFFLLERSEASFGGADLIVQIAGQ